MVSDMVEDADDRLSQHPNVDVYKLLFHAFTRQNLSHRENIFHLFPLSLIKIVYFVKKNLVAAEIEASEIITLFVLKVLKTDYRLGRAT